MVKSTSAVNSRLEELDKLRQSLEERTKDSGPIALFVESQTRDFVAKTVVIAFFVLLATIIVGVPLYNSLVEPSENLNLTDLLQQYSAILGPVLGFVIGYYFKLKE